MPIDECHCCGGDYHWRWEEAFDKFGFNDGDGQIETNQVADVLIKAGYQTDQQMWGMHNEIIISIKRDGAEYMPLDNKSVRVGYDCPRTYLPKKIIDLLDEQLPG